jgi:superfamily II DNA or RNA helicase
MKIVCAIKYMNIMKKNKLKDQKQKESVNIWAKKGFKGSIIAGTGFGKSRCGVLAIGESLRKNANKNWNALVLVPTIQLKDQFREEFIKWGYDDIVDDVIFTCYQTAYKMEDHHYNIVVCDEIHLGLSPEYRKFFEQNTCNRLLCMTATIPEDKEYEEYLNSLSPIVYMITLNQCVKLGLVSPYEIVCISIKLTAQEQTTYDRAQKLFLYYKYKLGQFDAFDEANRIIKDKNAHQEDKRNAVMFYKAIKDRKDVVDTASNKITVLQKIVLNNPDKKILTFSGSNDFTNKMCESIEPLGVTYHSNMTKKQRTLSLEQFKGNINVLCSTKALNQGFDVEGAEIGIICGLTSKSLTMIQRIGRLLRYEENKIGKIVIVYVADSQEDKWLKNAVRSFNNIKYINDIKKL